MDNGILGEINEFLGNKIKDDNMISLYEIIELIKNLKENFQKKSQILIKKMNKKLGKNLMFFNYEIKRIDLNENLELIIHHELEVKKLLISKNGEILIDIKNKETFKNILISEITELTNYFNEFLDLINMSIKTKIDNLNIEINNKYVGIFMYKSKNWITMGKAFFLKYEILKCEYNYEIDSIDLKKHINSRENELFNNIFIKKNLLPNDFQLSYETYLNKRLEKKSFIHTFINKLRNNRKKTK